MTSVVVTGLGACTSSARCTSDVWSSATEPIGQTARVGPNGAQIMHQSGPTPAVGGVFGAWELSERVVLEALAQAGLWEGEGLAGIVPEALGCTLSASKPLYKEGSWVGADEVPAFLHQRIGFRGESRNVIAACATGAYSIALAASWIEAGSCDVVIAGSVEPPAHPLYQAGFAQMGVLTTDAVMRPFDRDRQGFVINFGAGALILESAGHARRRGQPVLAQLTGWGLGADSHGIVAFNSGGQRIADVVARAIKRSQLAPEQITHINAHGTATRLNDRLETQALQKAFGPHAEALRISATKSSTGHLLGAAGSVEAVLTVEALRHQFIPPTRTLETADPECALNYTAGTGQAATFDHAMSLSFGFGGSIGALVFSRC